MVGWLLARLGWRSRVLLSFVAAVGAVINLRQSPLVLGIAEPYARDLYPHWLDDDGNCRSTREEVLIRQSLVSVAFDDSGCRVVGGRWYDPFSGEILTDPRDLDIDHFVPLAEAHRSGADRWDESRRARYANALEPEGVPTLIAVSASQNRSKADRDPVDWLPANWGYRCAYVRTWIAIKAHWGLERDPIERWTTDAIVGLCDSLWAPMEDDRPSTGVAGARPNRPG